MKKAKQATTALTSAVFEEVKAYEDVVGVTMLDKFAEMLADASSGETAKAHGMILASQAVARLCVEEDWIGRVASGPRVALGELAALVDQSEPEVLLQHRKALKAVVERARGVREEGLSSQAHRAFRSGVNRLADRLGVEWTGREE